MNNNMKPNNPVFSQRRLIRFNRNKPNVPVNSFDEIPGLKATTSDITKRTGN